MIVYPYDDVVSATLNYFEGDDLATNVWITKYALKNKQGEFLEKTPDDMHNRLTKEFARIENDFGGKRALSGDEIYSYFKDFKYITPQGSPMYGIGNEHSLVSLSSCTVISSPLDKVSSIMNTGRDMANLFKRRAGVGVDISTLRPEGATVNNSAGSSTGSWSFSEIYSLICRRIGQGGRRGALILTLDVRHPDIFKFVTMKRDLTKITGANISVKLTDKFMEAVVNDDDFTLKFPIDSNKPTFTRNIKARELWDVIINSATKTAEPGILMWDTVTKNLPAHEYEEFITTSTNPCSELPLSSNDSCRLIAINLKHLVENSFSSPNFDGEKFKRIVSVGQRLSDDLVQLEIEKLNKLVKAIDDKDESELWKRFIEKAERGRRTGLGTYGLADCLARMCIKYDSNESLKFIDDLYTNFRNCAYAESVKLSKERGPFPAFNWETEKNNVFINRLPSQLISDIEKHGRRNISLLTMAPTGSVSLVSKTSSGIEPVFRNSYTRRRKVSSGEKGVSVDFVDESGDSWAEFKVLHENVKEWVKINFPENTDISSIELPNYFVTSDKIDWHRRVEIQGIITENLDHSASSTINLPKGTTSETVGNIYMEAWKKGCKGITVYVDGSRSGVLIENKKEEDSCLKESFTPKRPESVPCDVHQISVKGNPWVVLVGKMVDCDGEFVPYEVFAGESSKIKIPKKYTKGSIVKRPRKTVMSLYDLLVDIDGDDLVVSDIVETFGNDTHAAFTRVISLSLRSGAPVRFVVEQLQKDKDSDMYSFSRACARVLKKYIKDGEKVTSDKYCSNCKKEGLIYSEGCILCTYCGWSKCA